MALETWRAARRGTVRMASCEGCRETGDCHPFGLVPLLTLVAAFPPPPNHFWFGEPGSFLVEATEEAFRVHPFHSFQAWPCCVS